MKKTCNNCGGEIGNGRQRGLGVDEHYDVRKCLRVLKNRLEAHYEGHLPSGRTYQDIRDEASKRAEGRVYQAANRDVRGNDRPFESKDKVVNQDPSGLDMEEIADFIKGRLENLPEELVSVNIETEPVDINKDWAEYEAWLKQTEEMFTRHGIDWPERQTAKLRETGRRMKEYLIFHYQIEGQSYVEAYPHRGDLLTECRTLNLGGSYNEGAPVAQVVFGPACFHVAWLSSPSRSQARRAAYTNWISAHGKGFNKLPYRMYSL